jgi:sugar phosphate isomerase/epimerase
MQYATQLYTLRSLPAAARCRAVAEAGFDGVELVGLDPVDTGELDVVAAHVGLETLEADPTAAVERALNRGTDTLVVPIVERGLVAPDAVERTADRLDALAAAVERAGGRLRYHNHEFEFGPLGGEGGDRADGWAAAGTAFGRLVESTTRLGFEVDVGWAAAAGVDPVAVLDHVGDRVPLVHLKDVRLDAAAPRGGHPVDLGAGDVDLDGVVDAAAAADVDALVFEHDDPADPARTVADAAAWLGVEQSASR